MALSLSAESGKEKEKQKKEDTPGGAKGPRNEHV
jgi:hypothetical protein